MPTEIVKYREAGTRLFDHARGDLRRHVDHAMGVKTRLPFLRFSSDDAQEAFADWGCNCGPGALAAVVGKTLEEVRPHVPGFDSKRYTSPTMMKAAVASLGWSILVDDRRVFDESPELPHYGLIRIQWTGPWTAPGANQKWAYGYTHWIAGFVWQDVYWAFDINSGPMPYEQWEREIAPLFPAEIKRADGKWFVTHSWELREAD